MKPEIVLRAILYMVLAAIPPWTAFFSGVIDKLTKGEDPLYHWAVWGFVISSSVYQAVLALRIYIDGSNERSRRGISTT